MARVFIFPVAFALCLAGAAGAADIKPDAQSDAKSFSQSPSPDPRNIAGFWYLPANGWALNFEFPLKPNGLEIRTRYQKAEADGNSLPTPGWDCKPSGPPFVSITPYPFKLIQTKGQVTMIQENMRTVRRIYLNREHPANLKPSFLGDSVGHWEGDTLVVDTVGMRPSMFSMAPLSEKTHVVERFRKINGGMSLENTVTVEDPEYFTKPWNLHVAYDWRPDERPAEYACEDGEKTASPWNWPKANRTWEDQ